MTNIKEGFKKLYLSVIIYIIGDIIGVIFENSLVFGLIGIGCMIVSFVINYIGLGILAKEEPGYQKAQKWNNIGIIVTIVCAVLSVVFEEKGMVGSIFAKTANSFPSICSFLVTYYVLLTSISVMKRINNDNFAEKVQRTLKFHEIAYITGIILEMIHPEGMIGIILVFVALIIMLVADVEYLVFLMKMPEELMKK